MNPTSRTAPTVMHGSHDRELAARLWAGDESAFEALVDEYQGRLARLARYFCRDEAVVEEAVQETWLAVIRGIGAFEGRAPLRSWIFSILANQARRLGAREKRMAQSPSGAPRPERDPDPDAEDGEEREPGMGPHGQWERPPVPWGLEDPASVVLRHETLDVIAGALDALPERQRRVVLLRDVEGLSAEEACNILGVTETNERVLLHRGRVRVRRALDAYLRDESRAPLARRGASQP